VLSITCTIERRSTVVWEAATDTGQLDRAPAELLEWLFRQNTFPDGVVLSTGTGVVPDLAVTLLDGDTVHIDISEVGRLSNTVRVGTAAFAWLDNPETRKA
jgi:2-dehydro-3-deoxy-D-arabinonate dehydratase